MPRSVKSLPVSLIGAGRVGSTMAVMLWRNGFRIASILSRTVTAARSLARRVHCSVYTTDVARIDTQSKILLFAVPEESLADLAEVIARTDVSPRYVFHVSGTETSDVLAPFRKKGSRVFSLHPIQTFPSSVSISYQIEKMAGVTYGFEGDTEALPFVRQLVRLLKGKLLLIPKERKILYHTACVFASNYSVAMLSVVEKLLSAVSKEASLSHIKPLIDASITNAIREGAAKALTGPIVRGSATTVRKQKKMIETMFPEYTELYTILGLLTLEVARKQKKLSDAEIVLIHDILSKRNSL